MFLLCSLRLSEYLVVVYWLSLLESVWATN
jgi:hypothetical protein